MNVHEYQAKRLLQRFDVPVPRGEVATDVDEARRAAQALGPTVVVKAQIHAGGRGKGSLHAVDDRANERPIQSPGSDRKLGGVAVVRDAEAAAAVAASMLGQRLVTRQTGAEGREVRRLLIEEGLDIEREFYLALLLDRGTRGPVFIASAEGGTAIEEVAAERPAAILRVPVDSRVGFSPWVGRRLAFGLGLGAANVKAITALASALHEALHRLDASQIEINPLVLTRNGSLVALDAKLNFDDNALYRQPEIAELRDRAEEDPLETAASEHGLNYIKLDGNVGCMVNGAGLAMSTMDIINLHGGNPANFLDVGGGATEEMVTEAFRILQSDDHVKAILINIFGGIMRCDVVAGGVVAAARSVGLDVPVVVRLEGTNVEAGRRILQESGLTFEVAEGMDDAARKVVAAAGA